MSEPRVTAKDIKPIDNRGYVPTLRADFVVLGMLSDYLGRIPYEGSLVERFYPAERKAVVLFLRYLTASGAAATADALTSGHIEVHSPQAKRRLDAFYEIEPQMFCPALRLREGVFPTMTRRQYDASEVDPRFSYLYGVYLRYGLSEPFGYRLANSVQRVELIKSFLADLDAEWVSHKYTLRTAPTCNELTFEPDFVLGTLLNKALSERIGCQEFDG
ncbi:MAG: hypothetical protein HY054_05325 [Proteobacteria bacterium]|nr:hypothetical protein [Pseudomonadota bacterium]